jgi:hypothetical protein
MTIKEDLLKQTTISGLRMITKDLDDNLLTKKFKYKDIFWRMDKESCLKDEIDNLEKYTNGPCYHFMESPTRFWNEFRNFVNHIDF